MNNCIENFVHSTSNNASSLKPQLVEFFVAREKERKNGKTLQKSFLHFLSSKTPLNNYYYNYYYYQKNNVLCI